MPERVEVVAEVREAGRVNRVDAARTKGAVRNEAGGLEDGKVLGNCGSRDGEEAGDIADGGGRGGYDFQNLASRGIGEGGEGGGGRRSVSNHLR